MLKDNLNYVEQQIRNACTRANRDRNEVVLIAVSKTKPTHMIREVMDAGIVDFGENKVQELCNKYNEIPETLHWHLIGHLQRNKVKNIVDKTYLIHSVDSLRLAIQIDEEARKKNILCSVLIEVNIANEDTKYGIKKDEALPLIQEIAKLQNVKIKGLMTIAPFIENPEQNRVHFRSLNNLMIDIKRKNIDNVDMNILSMGMTNDYEVAIEEGSTHVRVGTGIFGERNYTKDNL